MVKNAFVPSNVTFINFSLTRKFLIFPELISHRNSEANKMEILLLVSDPETYAFLFVHVMVIGLY